MLADLPSHLVDLGFGALARRRSTAFLAADPVRTQEKTLSRLVRHARKTRFGRDHGFERITTVADFQSAVPIRTYEALWDDYLRDHYPVFDDLTWPGRIPYLALTSGTTQGASKYIPVSREMVCSNRETARRMVELQYAAHPETHLFRGRIFFLGGSAGLAQVAPGVREGDLSGIAAVEVAPWLRPFTFPPLNLALESDWDRKLDRFAELSVRESITLVGGVPSWLLMLFHRILENTGKSSMIEVWPSLQCIVHGGVKFDPYRAAFRDLVGSSRVRMVESYACSEGFVGFGDPETNLLRLAHDNGIFYEFVPVDELASSRPTRHWLAELVPGLNYAIVVSTCAGMWAHLIGDTVRFDSTDPPLLRFTGRTKQTLSAFGEHLIVEELEAAVAHAASETGAMVRDWQVGPMFDARPGYHLFIVEFLREPADATRFRNLLDGDLSARNDDYRAHRIAGVGLPAPALQVAPPGTFENWMRNRGRLGGQNKVPRVDGSGELTRDLLQFVRDSGQAGASISQGPGQTEEGAGHVGAHEYRHDQE